MSRGWVIGSGGFAREMQERLAAHNPGEFEFALLGTDREGQLQARQAGWEAKLRELAREADMNLTALPGRKSAFEKVFLAAALKSLTSVSNRWLAQRLQLGKTSSVSSLVRQFRLAHGTTERFRAVVSRFMT